MVKKLLLFFWQSRHQFIRYFMIGCSGVILDMGTLYIFKEFFHLSPVLAVILNQLLITGYIFTLNKYWAFKAVGLSPKQLIRFLIIMSANYFFAVSWMWFWNHQLHFNYLLVRLVNIALCVTWNFLLYKLWVFKRDQQNFVCLTDKPVI